MRRRTGEPGATGVDPTGDGATTDPSDTGDPTQTGGATDTGGQAGESGCGCRTGAPAGPLALLLGCRRRR